MLKNISRRCELKTSTAMTRCLWRYFKFILQAVIKPLMIMINQSLTTGIFPKIENSWCNAILYKKEYIMEDNYRTV